MHTADQQLQHKIIKCEMTVANQSVVMLVCDAVFTDMYIAIQQFNDKTKL